MELRECLTSQGYYFLREIPGRGWCGLSPNLYTWGLFYGMDEWGRKGRYCFRCLTEAKGALKEWDGVGDPPGDWIKHYGDGGEYSNPNLPDELK